MPEFSVHPYESAGLDHDWFEAHFRRDYHLRLADDGDVMPGEPERPCQPNEVTLILKGRHLVARLRFEELPFRLFRDTDQGCLRVLAWLEGQGFRISGFPPFHLIGHVPGARNWQELNASMEKWMGRDPSYLEPSSQSEVFSLRR